MSTLIVMVVAGVVFALFATQNTATTTINLVGYFISLPLYLIVLGALLFGLLVSGIMSMMSFIATSMRLRKRDHTIHEKERSVEQLSQRVHELEVENAQLRENHRSGPITSSYREDVRGDEYRPTVMQRIRNYFHNRRQLHRNY